MDYRKRLHNGEVLEFGRLRLSQDRLELPGKSLKINTLERAELEPGGDIKLTHYGHTKEMVLIQKDILSDHELFVDTLRQLIEQVPLLDRRSVATAFPPGSIGDTSVRIGTDVRELYIDGYTQADIHKVLTGELSLSELMRQGPSKE